jgi:serine/threonine-protein kinase
LARRVRRRPAFSAAVAAGTLALVGLAGGGLWLLSDRAAAAREAQAERTATERAAEEDLREMVERLRTSSWPEARAALERAKGRLGGHGSADLGRRLDQGARELELATRLEEIRLDRAYGSQLALGVRPDEYEKAFRDAGLGQVGDDPELVAGRIRASNIPDALVAALDHWSVCTSNANHRSWVLSVARRADPDPKGWRDRARDPAVRADQAALIEVVRTAAVADQSVPLLLALNRHLAHDSRERLPFLKKVQQAHPSDFWANLTLAKALIQEGQPGEAIRYAQVAVAIRPRASHAYHQLGFALTQAGRPEEAVDQYRRAVAIDPTAVFSHQWLAITLFGSGRQDEAIEQLRVAIRINPNESGVHSTLARLLEITGRHAEALVYLRQAAALNPKDRHAQHQPRFLLVRLGRGDEALAEWQRSLKADPPEHDAWYGYAELRLFLDQEDEYRRARQALLKQFGGTTNPVVAERTARACLLRPATEGELRQAVALAERVIAVEPSKHQGVYPYVRFAQGLAEYRQGRFDRAIVLMRGEASRVGGPAPGLVVAMALYRSGQVAEARHAFAATVVAHDWRASKLNDQFDWTLHVLRREAESLILPNLPALVDGTSQPRDNDERLALVGAMQFTNRSLALARLYTDAFAADPKRADDVPAGLRSDAARAAALAGCGQGQAADQLPDEERARWRRQALDWLRQDLAWWRKRLDSANAETNAQAMLRLRLWPADSDLAGIRDPAALERLPPSEREEFRALWQEVAAVIGRARTTR